MDDGERLRRGLEQIAAAWVTPDVRAPHHGRRGPRVIPRSPLPWAWFERDAVERGVREWAAAAWQAEQLGPAPLPADVPGLCRRLLFDVDRLSRWDEAEALGEAVAYYAASLSAVVERSERSGSTAPEWAAAAASLPPQPAEQCVEMLARLTGETVTVRAFRGRVRRGVLPAPVHPEGDGTAARWDVLEVLAAAMTRRSRAA